jgi:hypothetical protein
MVLIGFCDDSRMWRVACMAELPIPAPDAENGASEHLSGGWPGLMYD